MEVVREPMDDRRSIEYDRGKPEKMPTLPKLPLPQVSPQDEYHSPYRQDPKTEPYRKKRITDLPMPPMLDEPEPEYEMSSQPEPKREPVQQTPKIKKPR
ncbi:hypothetical protein FSP39_016337 [Pinctada imbricata]|uniref:Uncharacterized protein n=1 Tax=Pinctada imbricata TaxID=66713 RepID=A0AA88YVG3_PINIB|nr:hypothetical protein FSP39_016337 [Pinctada imbricata]